jgi:hypothetical protein
MFFGWWFLASGLIWMTWNRVIGAVVKVKPAKYWQALILVATLVVFAAPRFYLMKAGCAHRAGCGTHCCQSKNCPHHSAEGGDSHSKDCPFSKQTPAHE